MRKTLPGETPLECEAGVHGDNYTYLVRGDGGSRRMARFTYRHVGSQHGFSRCKIARMERCYDDEWYAEQS